jgi:hypothetical protein
MNQGKEGPITSGSFAAPGAADAWRARVLQGEPNGDLAAHGPVFISEGTYNNLLGEYNLEIDQRTKEIMYGITGTLEDSSFYRGVVIAEGYLSHFFEADKDRNGFFSQFDSWLKSRNYDRFGRSGALMKNGACVGMGAVVKAFHLELGADFIDRLVAVPPQKVSGAFDKRKVERSATGAESIIDRIKNKSTIPSAQVFFNRFLGKLLEEGPVEIVEGAETMYGVIEDLWPEIGNPDPNKST